MRVLCLDVGEKRVGVAVSDPLSITAQGVETIHTRGAENDAMRVRELCGKYLTDRVLVGLPRTLSGEEGFQAQRVRDFARRLELFGLNLRSVSYTHLDVYKRQGLPGVGLSALPMCVAR